MASSSGISEAPYFVSRVVSFGRASLREVQVGAAGGGGGRACERFEWVCFRILVEVWRMYLEARSFRPDGIEIVIYWACYRDNIVKSISVGNKNLTFLFSINDITKLRS